MKNTLWTFGCSFTDEYSPINTNPPNNYDLYAELRGGSLPTIWAGMKHYWMSFLCQRITSNLKT